MSANKTLSFGPVCPSGSSWYACGSTFLGCCASNACTSSGCSQGNLQPVAFDPDQYGKFPDASCGTGSNFFTCTAGPTFWGCCKNNPCKTGGVCLASDLTGAFVGDPKASAYYLAGDAAATGTSTTGTSATSTSTISSTAPAGSSSAAAVTSSSNSKSNTAAIAGGSAAGGVVVALLVCWLIYYVCYVRRSRKKHQDQLERQQSDLAIATMTDKPNTGPPHHNGHDPPLYSSPNPSSYTYGPYEPNTYAYQHDMGSSTGGWKPQHRPRVSELSGETVWRGELESPMPSPHLPKTPQTPRFMTGEDPTCTGPGQYSEASTTHPLGIHTTSGDEIVPGGHQSVARR